MVEEELVFLFLVEITWLSQTKNLHFMGPNEAHIFIGSLLFCNVLTEQQHTIQFY